MTDQNAKRFVISMTPETAAKLEALAQGPRFDGNRSKAAAWGVEVLSEVLSDPAIVDRLFSAPGDVLAEYVKAHGGK